MKFKKLFICFIVFIYIVFGFMSSFVYASIDINFNGKEYSLPDIPEDLLNNYKYFFIRCYSSFAFLYCSNSNVIKGKSNYLKLYKFEYGKNLWEYGTEGTYNFSDETISALVYASDDLYDTDGNVVFQSSVNKFISPEIQNKDKISKLDFDSMAIFLNDYDSKERLYLHRLEVATTVDLGDGNTVYYYNDKVFGLDFFTSYYNNDPDHPGYTIPKYQFELENNKIYYSIIPDKNYFINKDNLKIDYNNLENILNEKLNFGKYIRIFDLLQLEDYYKTDSHWKQEKLIKIAQKFGQEMKLNLNNNYEEKVITEFKGVYSGQLPINEEKDEIKILTNNVLENCIVYNYEKNEATTIYNFDKMNSLDKYDIYLSGAVSLISIENTENKTGRELVVFRDSFASSFVPLLVEGYDKITLIDTRYISPKILSQYIEFNDQDILFLYSTSIINNSYTLK